MECVKKSLNVRPSVKPFSVKGARKLGRSEEMLLRSGWTFSGSELPSPKFNSSVRAGRSFAIRHLNRVIKPHCGNLDICLATRLTPSFGCVILLACFRSHIVIESERCFFGSCFSVVLLHNLGDCETEFHFGREQPEHADAPIIL